MKPVALDICCGKGGWAIGLMAAGFEVIGFDLEEFSGEYPGTFRRESAQFLAHNIHRAQERYGLPELARAVLVVASPPCQEFSRHDQPWTRKHNPPPPDLSIWKACQKIGRELGLPLIIENVRGAQMFMGQAAWHCGPFYLWGDVPALMPKDVQRRKKESMSSSAARTRAMIPFDLAHHIGKVFYPQPTERTVGK